MQFNKSIQIADSSIAIEIEKTIQNVPTDAWNAMSPGHPFVQSRWLLLLEYILADYEPRYILAWQGDRLIAGAVCHLQRKFHLSIYLKNKILRTPVSWLLRAYPPLTCTIPVFTFPGIIINSDIEQSDGVSILREAVRAVARQERSLFIGYNDLDPGTGDILSMADDMSQVSLPPESLLDIEWDTYEAYQAALPKKKRAEIRRVRNRAREHGVTVKAGELENCDEKRIERLIRNVAERHGNRYLYKPNLFQNALKVLEPDDYRLLMVCHHDEIIGNVLLLCSQGVMLVKWIGLDYPRTEPTLAYHYLMTETVYHAIEMKVKRLVLGVTTYTLKKKMGAVLEPRFAAIQFRQKPFNALLNHFLAKGQNDD